VLSDHLRGRGHVGVYPLRPDDTCTVLACDFDGASSALDARAYHDAALAVGLSPLLERSRSGDGAHVWLFFADAVPASVARRLGCGLLRTAMEQRAELDLASYDRLFPSQDALPANGFGNLIALPLQGACRRAGTTVFLDPTALEPFEDQWAALSAVTPADATDVQRLAARLDPFLRPPGSRSTVLRGPAPATVRGRLDAGLTIDRAGLPAWLVAEVKHLASLPNPAYFEKQRLRLSPWNIPRVVRCYRETLDGLELPRGLREPVEELLASVGSRLEVLDVRPTPPPATFAFSGVLRPEQQAAVEALSEHEHGMLVAPPGTGKTVIGCALIARHRTPTLVLVDRRPLAEQWRARLGEFLGLDRRHLGQLGGGRTRLSGVVDVALLQSLTRRSDCAELFARYGLVVVDECHHAPAASYEPVLWSATSRRWLGLTATPFRADRLDPLIAFHCGPIRHRVPATAAATAPLTRRLHLHATDFAAPGDGQPHIQEVFRALAGDPARNRQIAADTAALFDTGRRVLVLSQRKDHLEHLAGLLRQQAIDPLMLVGGRSRKTSREALRQLEARAAEGGVVALATGSYLGEGIDLPSLDALVLAFPISFKGRVIQYVGRLLRHDPSKTDIAVHDYQDPDVPVLVSMARKRLPTYRRLGFAVPASMETPGIDAF
jgi:superfamily II DNA or RNA helicase